MGNSHLLLRLLLRLLLKNCIGRSRIVLQRVVPSIVVPKSIVVLAEDDVLFSFKGLLLLLIVLVICRTRNMAPLGLKQEPWFLLWSSGKMASIFSHTIFSLWLGVRLVVGSTTLFVVVLLVFGGRVILMHQQKWRCFPFLLGGTVSFLEIWLGRLLDQVICDCSEARGGGFVRFKLFWNCQRV